MIRINLIRKEDVAKRVAQNLPAYGVVLCWSEVVFVDLLDKKMRTAFFDRFNERNGSSDGIYYASGLMEFDASKNVDLEPGKCIMHNAKLKQVKTTKTFYKYYQHSEEEYWKVINGELE